MLWTNNVEVRILHNSLQFIHMEVMCTAPAVTFLLSAVYGSPQPRFRKLLWEDLHCLSPHDSTPWLLAGDFNAIVSAAERTGGAATNRTGCTTFKSFINNLALIDMGFCGHKFTWRRGTLMERLDRALCNTTFIDLFPNCTVEHLSKLLSDHRPIAISIGTAPALRHHHFRFPAPWLTHPAFSELIRQAWAKGNSLTDCIASFSSDAAQWNLHSFGHVGRKKRRILARLKGLRGILQQHPYSDFHVDLEQSLAEELEEICFQEELLVIDAKIHL